jgi:polyisoprenoid-binding protein YceI
MNVSRLLRSSALLLAVSLSAGFSQAQATAWKIDSAHSGVEFKIRHLGVSNVNGSFSKVAGTVYLDDKDITKSKVEAVIDATTVNTNDAGRDKHLATPEFFDTAKYPTMTFKSTSVFKEGGKLKMTGDLTISGVTKPVTLDLDGPAPAQKGMHGGMVSGFSATGTLSRKDFNFGQKYGAPLLGDDVKFTIDIEMDKP